MKNILCIMLATLCFVACKSSSNIKEIKDFANYKWPIAKKVVFKFDIKDTTKTYQINYLIRNSIEYPYYNLYMNQTLKSKEGKVLVSTMDELILFEKKTGKPKGAGMGDIFDNRFTTNKISNIKFPKAGQYMWELTHNMRPDPIEGVMSVGIEVLAKQ